MEQCRTVLLAWNVAVPTISLQPEIFQEVINYGLGFVNHGWVGFICYNMSSPSIRSIVGENGAVPYCSASQECGRSNHFTAGWDCSWLEKTCD